MQDFPIQIGAIGLQGFEVPSSVRFGGRYRLVVHTLSGGRRLVERLGPDDDAVEFQGVFSGASAESRARSFDELRQSGEIVWLTWQSFRRQVVVKSFVAEYHSPWWIPYRASCVVTHQTGVASLNTSTLSGAITADFATASSALAGSDISLGSLQISLSGPNALTAGTSAQTQAVAAAAAAMDAINRQIADQSALIAVPLPATTSAFGAALTATVNGAGLLAAAVNSSSYIGRIKNNLTGSER